MFHHDWILPQLAQEHRRDLLRQAEQERLARQASPANDQRGHKFYHVLDFLGRRLVIIGEHLQTRHTAIHTRSLMHTSRGQS